MEVSFNDDSIVCTFGDDNFEFKYLSSNTNR